MKRLSVFVLFILFALSSVAQIYELKGKVIDSETKEPLAFVNIKINDGKYGGTTDIDGKFNLRSDQKIHLLSFSYIGYEPFAYPVLNDRDVEIKLKSRSVELDEVVILPGVNPAHRIIRNVIANRDQNNPEKLEAFSYTAYDKLVVTSGIDSAAVNKSILEHDTSFLRAKAFFDEQDIFLMESVVERKFMKPDRNYENVIAQRISGFKDPIFTFLLSQIQSTSFYNPIIHLIGKHYVNPINNSGLSKYIFILNDTTLTPQGDSVFTISYQPKFNAKFDGLKGVLMINSKRWAIQNVIAEPFEMEKNELFSLKIQQLYELIDDKYWFPKQLNTDIKFDQRSSITISTNDTTTEDNRSFAIIATGKSYLMNVKLNPNLVKREFSNIEIELAEDAGSKSEDFWYAYRGDTLSARDQKTYHFMDSIGEEEDFDKAAKTLQLVLNGQVPIGGFNLDLNKVISYSDYESVKLGLGLFTNTKFSEKLKLGGEISYGIGSKQINYKGEASYLLDNFNEVKVGGAIYKMNMESSSTTFFDDEQSSIFDLETTRQFLINRMNTVKGNEFYMQFRALRDFKIHLGLRNYSKRAFEDYAFNSDGPNISYGENPIDFQFTDLNFGVRWSFNEKFFKRGDLRMSLGTKYPVVHFNYTKGFDGFLGGEHAYNRFDLRVQHSFFIPYVGESTFRIQAGYIDSPLPLPNLYNGIGSYRSFTIYAPYSFATMRMNEFLSDKYLAIFYTHSFGELLLSAKWFSPEIVIANNFGIGSLKNSVVHEPGEFSIMDKGYFESGLLLNDIIDLKLYTIGFGVFYRYGPYHLPKTMDNIAFKFTLKFAFGLN
ncbi:MAG: hypothetical protein CL663_00365 [Bacteroidetes bacterium]|nr:hypothetical protein [Bacteroidota bacterium]